MGQYRFNTQRRTWMIDYIDAGGRRIRQTIGAGEEGKRLARKVLTQREAEAQLGIHHLPGKRTARFGEFAEEWFARKQARRLSPKTLECYRDQLDCHLLPAFAETRLGLINQRDIEGFVAGRTMLAPCSVNQLLVTLRSILKEAVERKHLMDNPAAKVQKVKDRDQDEIMHVLQPAEVARLLKSSRNPWRTLYLVAVHTGLRRGELLALRWRDVDLAKGLLSVRGSRGRVRDGDGFAVLDRSVKTRASRRLVDLSPALREALLAFPAGDDSERDYVFRNRAGGPIDPDDIHRAFKRDLTLAGLPDMRFHDLRHTHASLLIAAGVHPKAIQARLGHSSIGVTMNTYGHLMPSAYQGVGEKLDALLQDNNKATSTEGPAVESAEGASTLALRH